MSETLPEDLHNLLDELQELIEIHFRDEPHPADLDIILSGLELIRKVLDNRSSIGPSPSPKPAESA